MSLKLKLPKTLLKVLTVEQIQKTPTINIVLTGGPCGGKSSAMDYVEDMLKQFTVYKVPETPTLTVLGGGLININNMTFEENLQFQSYLLKFQRQIEDYFNSISQLGDQPSIIFYDRGQMDPRAYMNTEQYRILQQDFGVRTSNLRDRYDIVVHMVSTAKMGPEIYHHGNVARYETLEQAVALDDKTERCYLGHPHLLIVENPNSFEAKLELTMDNLKKGLWMEYDRSFNGRYLLNTSKKDFLNTLRQNNVPNVSRRFNVQTLQAENSRQREYLLREGSTKSFVQTELLKSGKKVEKSNKIDAVTNWKLSEQGKKGVSQLSGDNVAFLYKDQAFNVKFFDQADLSMLYMETSKQVNDIVFPDFLNITKNVTNDNSYGYERIATDRV